MPPYNASPQTQGGQSGIPQLVWNAEQPAPGNGGASASQAVALPKSRFRGLQAFSVAAKFAAAPGAFEVDVQVADVDADANYQTVASGNVTTVDATNNTFRFDGSANTGLFVRLLMRSRTNAVNITATITPC